ncbi:hypothetical protein, partial [Mycobacterium tuberculosis]
SDESSAEQDDEVSRTKPAHG